MDGLFTTFLGSLTSLVLCMAVGYICRLLRILDDRLIAGMTTLLVKVTLPCTVFVSMLRPFSSALMLESIATFFISGAVYLFSGLLALLLARLMKAEGAEKRVWLFALIFANVGYMGFPVTQAVFGEDALIYTSMATSAFNVLVFTLGVRLYTHTPEGAPTSAEKPPAWRQILLNPALAAMFAGFVFFLAQIRPPWPVNDALTMLSGMTSPVSMLLVGSILAKGRLRDIFDLRIVPAVAVRLLLVPLIVFFILRIFIHNPMMLGVLVVLSAMPAAAITAIFAEHYKSDTALASKLVALSTLFCVITLPLISLLLGSV
jgi:hypothetical protein